MIVERLHFLLKKFKQVTRHGARARHWAPFARECACLVLLMNGETIQATSFRTNESSDAWLLIYPK